MNAVTYHKVPPCTISKVIVLWKSKNGIRMTSLPRPTMKYGRYKPASQSKLKNTIVSIAWKVLQCCYGLILAVLHPFVTIPNTPVNQCDTPLVLVKVHAVGINPVDAKCLYGDKVPFFLYPVVRWLLEDHICGIDFSGVVEGVASQSTVITDVSIYIGEEVFGTVPPGWGSLAEYILVPMNQLTIKPKEITHVQAAALPLVSLTAMQGMCSVLPGHRVLVIGASGGAGHVAVQYAIMKGAHVTCICSLKNMEFVRSLNPLCVIAYDGDDVMTALHHHVDHTGPYDFVYDTVSSNEIRDIDWNYYDKITASPSLLYHGSKYVTLGGSTGEWTKAHLLRFFGIDTFPRGKLLHWVRFSCSAEELAQIADHAAQGKLLPHVSKVVSFTEQGVREAFDDMHSRRTVGKIVVKIVSSS